MEKNFITEEQVKVAIDKILNEEKVSRMEYGRVLFKIEELENSLKETANELRKLQSVVPRGLKNITDKKLTTISSYISASQNTLLQVKDKVRQHKRSSMSAVVIPSS
jgi:ferritin-like metal-binding protein YciE